MIHFRTNNQEKYYKSLMEITQNLTGYESSENTLATILESNDNEYNLTDLNISSVDTNISTIEQPYLLQNESLFVNPPTYSQNFYINLYTFFIIGSIILTTLRSLLFFKVCMRASKNLHNTMFNNLLRATMRFFDINPSGRILTRFSKDMGQIDETLPRAMLDAIQIFMVMSGILAMVFIVSPWMILPTVVLAVIFLYIRVIYLASGQDIKRLESISKFINVSYPTLPFKSSNIVLARAPVFSHVSASMDGLTTIRACGAQYMVSKEFDVLQDQHTSSWYLFLATTETFGFYLDVICVIFLAVVTFQFLIFDDGA